ncbi:MAG: hypothetical protein GF317_02055 [Candidatus Lokiarchaeota archaeon]|nr:hypothetical protein [Candidatus Lokiarchaeota archaeon]MBD3198723.1 hypothetical protein [Candidatus Lokiarchaeota archaeon]
MERLQQIKSEIEKKEGKIWLGLQASTEKQLDGLIWYIDHPQLMERPKLAHEIVELYENAKITAFTKMEGIKRKLDQLSITLGKIDYEKKEETSNKRNIINYRKAILDLRDKITKYLSTPNGKSLPDKTQETIINLVNYLNHPDLKNKQRLFDEIIEKYEAAEAIDFTIMQSINDLVNKLEIKLGEITPQMKKFKTTEELRQEIEEERDRMTKEREQLTQRIQSFKQEKKDFEFEKRNILSLQKKLEEQQHQLEKQWEEIEKEREKLRKEAQKFEDLKRKIEMDRREL